MVVSIDNENILCDTFEEYVAGYQIIDKISAIKGIEDFFDTKGISKHLRWEEL